MKIQDLSPVKDLRQAKQFRMDNPFSSTDRLINSYQQSQERSMNIARQAASQKVEQYDQANGFYPQSATFDGQSVQMGHQGSVMPGRAEVTQKFGNYNPGLYRGINKSMTNTGTDFALKPNTPLALPPGTWEVMEAFDRASGGGRGNKQNMGYGNSVLVRNTQTGETLRFSHLNGVNVQRGRTYKGGTVLGTSGATGNVTGPHLDLEYRNEGGQLADVLTSRYSNYLFGG